MPTEIKAAFIGFCGTIIAAVIAFVSVIITLKCKKRMKLSTEQSFARFLTQKDCLKEIIANVESISAYTVNSHEIYNKLNTIFEQNPMIAIERVTLLVRKKADEKSKDIDLLNQNIELWKVLVQKQKIKNLTIIAYDHDPDHYYTLLVKSLLFCGQVLFDETMPTGTKVDYSPLAYDNSNELGRQVIEHYQKHFDNVVQHYEKDATLYNSQE